MGNTTSTPDEDYEPEQLDERMTLSPEQAMQELQAVARMVQGSLALGCCDKNHVSLSLAFQVDAPMACRICSFLLASESKTNGAITSKAPVVPGAPVFYNAGLNQAFPYSDTDKSYHHVLDVRHMSTDHLHREGTTYPLLIRIESISSSMASYNYDIRSLPAGGPLPKGVNAHTVFARFKFRPNGCWQIQVLHQRLWVNGRGYEMPSIAPAPKAAPKPQATVLAPRLPPVGTAALAAGYPPVKTSQYPTVQNAGAAATKCMMCHVQPVEFMATPCHHASMCTSCALQQQKAFNNYCPVCYKAIQGLVPIGQHGSPRGKAGAAA